MFQLSEEQQEIVELVREYATDKIAPLAEEIDHEGRFPRENIEGLTEMGFMGLCIPEEYGGIGMDELTKSLVIIELAKVCASTAVIVDVHYLVSDIIMHMANGDFFVVIALTDPEKKTHGGMTAFLVDRDNPGLSVGKTENKMGIKGSETSELWLTDCRVPETAILGKIGDGFKIAMIGLDGGRIGISSQAVGIAEGALAEAVKYAGERIQFGKPIAANQGLQWYIAEMATRTEAAKMLVYEAADLRERGEDCTKVAAMAKLFAGEAACFVTDLALQIHGGYGYMKDYPIERMYRDARITRIYEGTSEVQKMVIARSVMKK